MNQKKLLFFIIFGAGMIALYLQVNSPELKESARVYTDFITFALAAMAVIFVVFKGKISSK